MPYLWEGTSSVTQHQGPVGSGKLVGVLFLGAGPLTGTLGKYWGREEGRKTCFTGRIFQLQHDQWFCLKNFVMGVGVTCGNSKPFSCYFQKLNICIFLFCLFLPSGREGFPYCVPTGNIQSVYFRLVASFWLGFFILKIQEGK